MAACVSDAQHLMLWWSDFQPDLLQSCLVQPLQVPPPSPGPLTHTHTRAPTAVHPLATDVLVTRSRHTGHTGAQITTPLAANVSTWQDLSRYIISKFQGSCRTPAATVTLVYGRRHHRHRFGIRCAGVPDSRADGDEEADKRGDGGHQGDGSGGAGQPSQPPPAPRGLVQRTHQVCPPPHPFLGVVQ